MSFAWPYLLWLLLLPAGLLLRERSRRRRDPGADRPKILRAEAGMRSVHLTGAAPQGRARARGWMIAGLALACVALARPQWGRIDEPVFDQSREVLIALDLSRSMLTRDVKPSRLERAKLLIQSLLDHLSGERVGLAIFSGTAFLQAPLSADYEILSEFLPALGPDYMPEGGTNYGALIDVAANAFTGNQPADRFLIILSDGGATDDDWRRHISRLTDKGIRVIGLGVGTPAGDMIPDGSGGFVKDERGAVVMARLESETLRELAAKTGGVYRDASSWVDLPKLLQATVEAGRKGKFVEKGQIRLAERFQWFLAPAFLCLLASLWLESPVRPRPRDVRLAAAPAARPAEASVPMVAILIAFGCLVASPGRAAETGEAAPIARIVSRLSSQDRQSAADWAELSTETVAWGERIRETQQPVPSGPVRDALQAVAAGSAENPRAADWPKLRSELEALLQNSDQKPPPQQQKQNQSRQNQSQRQQQNGGGPGSSTPEANSQPQDESQKESQPGQSQPGEAPPNPAQPRNDAGSGLGSMDQPQGAPPKPQSDGTQQVGGRRDQREVAPASADPELAASMGKLDQIRDQDSPAQLYQMIENNEPHPASNPAKNW